MISPDNFTKVVKVATTMDCKILSSSFALQVQLTELASLAWNAALKFMVLALTNLVWTLRFLISENNFLNCFVTVQWWTNIFGCFHGTMALFEFIKHKFLNLTLLYIYVCSFQITQGVKQSTSCQHTNYYDITKHSGYLQ